jgi:hypothetical protein
VVDCGVNEGTFWRLFSEGSALFSLRAWSLCHILFPLWLFVNFNMHSNWCVVSHHPLVSRKRVVCMVLLFEGLLCGLTVAFWWPEAHYRKLQHWCGIGRSLIFYLVLFILFQINRKTRTRIWGTKLFKRFGTSGSNS